MRMISGAAVGVLFVGAEAPHAVDALHLMDDAGVFQRIKRAVKSDAVQVVVDHRKNLAVRHWRTMPDKQLKYDPALARSTQSGAAQDFFRIQENSPSRQPACNYIASRLRLQRSVLSMPV